MRGPQFQIGKSGWHRIRFRVCGAKGSSCKGTVFLSAPGQEKIDVAHK